MLLEHHHMSTSNGKKKGDERMRKECFGVCSLLLSIHILESSFEIGLGGLLCESFCYCTKESGVLGPSEVNVYKPTPRYTYTYTYLYIYTRRERAIDYLL